MKNTASRASNALVTLCLAAALLPCGARGQERPAEVLNNESVVQMLNGKVPKNLIVQKIQSTKASFDVTPRGLAGLYVAKVPTDVIKLMIQVATPRDSKEVLTNDDVIYMMNNKLPRDIILAKVQATPAHYDLTAGALVSLNQNKVPQDVMKAMMTAPPPPPPAQAVVATPPAAPAPPPATSAAGNSPTSSGSLGKIFIRGAASMVNGKEVPDAALEETAKDMKKRPGKFTLATNETDADFLLVVAERKETAVSGKPAARNVVARLSTRNGVAWKQGPRLESGNTNSWNTSADKVMVKAEDWVKANSKKP